MEDSKLPKLLKYEEVAYRLGQSYNQTRQLILYGGKLPYVVVGKKGIRVKEEDLVKYIASLEAR